MFDLTDTQILITFISILFFGKPMIAILVKLFPPLAPLAPLLEKLSLNGNNKTEPPQWAMELKQHFNDEITQNLKEIRDGVRDMNIKLDSIEPCKK